MKNVIPKSTSPIIGISASLLTIDSGSFIGHTRSQVVHDYVKAVTLSGGIPLILPVIEGKEFIEQQMKVVDGLILSGGYDISPFCYHEEPKRGLDMVYLERDNHEIQLIKTASEMQKPILGICRGLQILNVAFGGNLYQDIGSSIPNALQHYQKSTPADPSHSVKITVNTKLHQIIDEESILANSFHHQAIKDLAKGFISNAHSTDGLIEGIESTGDSFILGVQWHPELMIAKSPKMLKLFLALVKAAKELCVNNCCISTAPKQQLFMHSS